MTQLKCITLLVIGLLFSSAVLADGTYYLVRHAEKQKDPANNPALTKQGKQRAQFLAQQLSLANITKIYSTDTKRTRATAKPLADMLGLEIEIYDARQLKEFSETLKRETGQILIVGHSNTTPPLAELLSGSAVDSIDESEYENLYQVVLIDGKARLSRFRIFPTEGTALER